MGDETVSETDILQTEVADGVAILTMNRPAQRNAMSQALVGRLIESLIVLDNEPAVRAILLEGAGAGFCAGSDLGGLAAMTEAERSLFEAESGRLSRMFAHVRVPVVASVHGFAIGGGLTLAAGCDIVVTEAAVRWSLPEVPIGLFPAWGLWAVSDRIGRPASRRLAWGIDMLDGNEATRLGLADHVADGAARTEALAIAHRLAALPPAQSASVKHYFAGDPRGEEADMLANRLFMQATRTPQAAASFRRFAAKG